MGVRTTRAVAAPASGSRRTPLVTTTHARRARLCYGTRPSQLPTRAPPPPLTAHSFSRRSSLGDARRAAPGPPDGHLLKTDMSRMSGGARLRPLIGTSMMPSAAVSALRRGHKTNATRRTSPGRPPPLCTRIRAAGATPVRAMCFSELEPCFHTGSVTFTAATYRPPRLLQDARARPLKP